MGFHHSNTSFQNTQDLQDTVDKYESLQMPIESIGNDINMNDQNRAFTVNTAFKDILEFVRKLHNPDLKYNMYFIGTVIPAFI